MKRVFSLIVSVTMLGMVSLSACSVPDSGGPSSSSASSSAPEKYEGTVSRMSVEAAADGDFKILQLSDIQIIDPDQQPAMPNVEVKNMYRDLDACAFDQVRWLVEKTQPDFIVLTGDNVYGEFDHDGSNFSALVALMESFKTPWTLVFGNHDGETYPGKGMAWQSNYLLENTEYCVFSVGNDYYETEGYGNFVVDIEDGNGIRCSLIMMDSHGCRREMNAGIYPNQIKWYEACVNEAAEIKHGEFDPDAGKVVPSYVFFHIPIEQFDKAMNEKYGGVNGIGSVSENDNGDFGKNRSSASFVDKNGFFAKAKSLESTKGIFAAHSHLNNSSVLYQGIRLTYGTKTGVYDEHDTEMLGGKLLTVNGSGEMTVKEVLYDGELPNEDDYADSETPGGSSGGGEAPVDPTPTPGPENTNLGIVVKDIAHSPTEADWAEATAYDMLPNTGNITGATGKVKILTSGGNIYYRMDVTDPSTDANADGIYIYLGNGEKTYEARGNYENWLAAIHNDFGSQTELFMRTTAKKPREYLSGVYSFVQGFDLGGLIKEGASIRLVLKHRDSRSVWEPWRDGDYTHTIYFDQQITFGKQAEGGSDLPENNGVVVKNLTHAPTEADWAGATAYKMQPNTSLISGAVGTVKILSWGSKLYYRMEVDDPTTDINCDGIYVYVGTDAANYTARGNYDMWLALKNNDFKTPLLMEMSTTAAAEDEYLPGKYTFTHALDIGELYSEGASIRIILKHRDSRSAWEPWRDGDYEYTITFDQIITFESSEKTA